RGDPVGTGGQGKGHRAHGRIRPLGQHPALLRRRRSQVVLEARRRRPGLLREEAEALMARIFDFAGREVDRLQTVAGLRALRRAGPHAAQTTAESAEEAAAADAAGIEMVVCRGANVRLVRLGSSRLFVTAALGFTQAATPDDMLRAAFSAVEA